MNFIMNKTKISLKTINVNKFMVIYMNQQTIDRFQKVKHRLQFAKININENRLCEMKNMLLEKNIIT